jgi:hypothetical protein
MVALDGVIFRLSLGTAAGSMPILTRLDAATGHVLASRQIPGAGLVTALNGRLWLTAAPASTLPAEILEVDAHSLATELTISIPHRTDFRSVGGVEERLGSLAYARGRLWAGFGQHYFAFDPATGRQLDDVRATGRDGYADSLTASADGTRIWTGGYSWRAQIVPVEERDARTGAVIARTMTDAYFFQPADAGVWAVNVGGMQARPVLLSAAQGNIRIAMPAGDEFNNALQIRPAAGALWLTDAVTVRCADLAGHLRITTREYPKSYDHVAPLAAHRLLLVETDANVSGEQLLVATPKPACLR